MTPFEHFFAVQFEIAMRSVGDGFVFTCPTRSIKDASWDRKAAYLLWTEMGRPDHRNEDFGEKTLDGDWDIL